MADRPMPFSDPMVSALLAGRKTQTRRALNPQPVDLGGECWHLENQHGGVFGVPTEEMGRIAPDYVRIQPGDRLWVRETYFQRGHWETVPGVFTKGGRPKWAFVSADHVTLFDAPATYRKGRHNADPAAVAWHKRLGRFMPRQYSRLTLIVEAVKVERLKAISETDAIAEGLIKVIGAPARAAELGCDWGFEGDSRHGSAISAYAALWNSINGPGSWEANPWVAAYTFRVINQNIDQVAALARHGNADARHGQPTRQSIWILRSSRPAICCRS